MESKILGDVARELENNNVHKMAQEIFSFYVCARWAPDSTFWELAKQELPAQLNPNVVDIGAHPGQAIAEAYQTYKFVPMLCSRNLNVFGETDDDDFTHFTKFEEKVRELAAWLQGSITGPITQRLTEIDNLFCGDRPMNDCKAKMDLEEIGKKLTSWCPKWLCGEWDTREELLQ